MLINEVAEKLGVHQGTIRNWERRGKIEPPQRDWINRRVFTEKDLEKLLEMVRSRPVEDEGND